MPLPTAAELTDPNATNTQMKQRLGQLAENVESKEDATTKANAAQANAIAAAATDATTKANAAQANAIAAAATDATSKANAAQANAIAAAATDATTKANAAEANAKAYVDVNDGATRYDSSAFYEAKFYSVSGLVYDNRNAASTDLIPVKAGDKVSVIAKVPSSTYAAILVYNSSGTFVRGVASSVDSTPTETTTTIEADGFVRSQWMAGGTPLTDKDGVAKVVINEGRERFITSDGVASNPVIAAKAEKIEVTAKANAAEANAKVFSRQLNKDSLKQGEFQKSGIGLLFTDRRGIPNWIQSDEEGMPTEFARDLILDPLKNRLLYNASGLSAFVVSDRRGVALIDSDQSAVSVSNKYDLTTVKFHGSSTMRYMQSELFAKLKNEFKQIQAALYTNKNSGGTLNDLATEIGINDGLLKFTDNEIYASAPSPVVGVGLKYGLPTTYDIPISLTNGFKGTLKNTGFIASNVTSDFELPVDLEINFKSDMTDYANCVSILNLGKNNMSGSNTIVVNNIVGMTRDAVTFLDKENGGHTLVIGHTTNRGSNVDFVKNVKDVNAQLKALYFKRYFGLFDYIFSDEIWIDTGLTKSADDISAIAAETLPPSLTNDGIHLNSIANSAVTTKIVQFIQTLGWY